MYVLVTGASGFLGKNLVATLENIPNLDILTYDSSNTEDELFEYTKKCEFVFHLAGINRPEKVEEFYKGNADTTALLCNFLQENNNNSPIVISSSIQAAIDNDYGKSKLQGEEVLKAHATVNNSEIYIYRLKNLFGKWSKPNYNTVVATWCYNISRGIETEVSNNEHILELCYVDDVVKEFINALMNKPTMSENGCIVDKSYSISLIQLKNTLISFKDSRENFSVVNTGDELTAKLYATYLSFLPEDEFNYFLKMNKDDRGSFTEFLKTNDYGQVSVNVSKPGITKGNHWHHTKNEKFLVVSGTGIIRFRKIGEDKIIEYKVSSTKLEVIDIPTGYTHNIENIGQDELVTIMWASEQFDPLKPDTFYLEV